ncbi:protein cornichon homolog 4-like [Daphnia carinata]|uniref:protein cornichon homolog 4-like n=1 Tax=Daphnia carinata TaxID=120202 RepID=UPI002579F8BE|nr:protein cornichon homolog 4-like [Daphnia carinata]
MSDTLMFAFCLFDTGALLFLLVYYIITLSDLECDYLNAQQCCSNLNIWIFPRIIAHLITIILLSFTGHWWIVLTSLPVSLWLIYECVSVPRGNMGVYDPTEIYNRGQLKKHMRDCMIGLGYYLIMFFVYLYCMILSMLAGDPRRKEDPSMINDLNP